MHVIPLVLGPAAHVETQIDHVRGLARGVVQVHGMTQVVFGRATVAGSGYLVYLLNDNNSKIH